MKKLSLTRKIRIFPTQEQIDILWVLSEKCRLLYNFALAERIEVYEKREGFITYVDQANKLPQLKKDFPEYGYVYSKVLQSILKTLDGSYKSFFKLCKKDKTARPPKFRGKNFFFTMLFNQSGFKLSKGNINLSHKYNKTKLDFKIPKKFVFDSVKQVNISMESDKWFVSIVYDESVKEFVDNKKILAIDLGIKYIATGVDEKVSLFKRRMRDLIYFGILKSTNINLVEINVQNIQESGNS